MKKILFFALCMMLVACAPSSKAKYMTQFNEFMNEVSQNYKSYTDKDWEKVSKQYQKLTNDWYYKFENELTMKDELRIASYRTKWTVYRNLGDIKDVINEVTNSEEINEMKKEVKDYIENDLQNDLQTIEEETRDLRKEIVDGAKDVIDEVSKGLE